METNLNNSSGENKKEKSCVKKKKHLSAQRLMKLWIIATKEKNNINATTFWNFYESKGWLVGKTKMKDWKAAIRTWESKEN